MYLKKIELFGFKSFADKTSISFEEGITAIVGPNGCGKSNISDGIRWVLGEKRAKMLRGIKMEDLIFAGTDFRKPLGFAEVSLTIDNAENLFPIQYSDVILTRRLYRSGESEYLLNKTPCRLKDIQDLLMNTGIGSNAYSMIEQGEIDYIVSAKADERRFLIEEAAGISKYKNKKDEALRKLDRTELNLQRVNDIVAEIEKNIKYAERQARKAERYRLQFEQLKNYEVMKARRDIKAIAEEIVDLKRRKNSAEERSAVIKEYLDKHQAVIDEIDKKLFELERRQHECEEERFRYKSDMSSLQDKMTFNHEKIDELHQRNESLETDAALSKEKIEKLHADVATRKSELESFRSQSQEEKDKLIEMRNRREELIDIINREKESLDRANDLVYALNDELTQKRNELQKIESGKIGLDHKKQRIEQTLQRLNAEENDILVRMELSKDEVQTIIKDYNITQGELNRLQHDYEKNKNRYTVVQNELIETRGSAKEIESKLKAIEELAQSGIGFKRGTQSLIENWKEADGELNMKLESVLDSIVVREGYEYPIQTLLQDTLYCIVATSYEEGISLVREAQIKEQGSVDILVGIYAECVEKDKPVHESILGVARDFVTFKNSQLSSLIQLLDRTIVVDSFKSVPSEIMSLLIGKWNIVSLQGELLLENGMLRWKDENDALAGALVQEEKKKKLRNELTVVKEEITKLADEERSIKSYIEGLAKEITNLSDQVVDRKITLESNQKITHSIKDNLNKIRDHKNILEIEKKEADEEYLIIEERSGILTSEIKGVDSRIKEAEKERNQLNESLDAKEKQREHIQIELASLETACAAVNEKEEYLLNAVNIVELGLNDEQIANNKRNDEYQSNKERVDKIIQENREIEEKLRLLQETANDVEQRLDNVKNDRAEVVARKDAEFESSKGHRDEYQSLKDELHTIHLKEMELQYQETSNRDRLMQSYKINIDEFELNEEYSNDVNFDTIDEDIALLTKRVESLGTVNLLAIEEHKELQDRYTFLIEQRTDLEQAQRALLEAIRKINRTTKQLFVEVFEQVQRNFQYYFGVLFEGGVAELTLVDEENPLESGIDIFVRPPGKKLQNIQLLSGGEKALTAVALLFALFKVKPSPFCVLDEVDAPLDEANIDRFLAVVKEFSNTTQFIIVTHNRKTIGMAHSLFGITMEEAGVSKIVSVKIADISSENNTKQRGDTHDFNKAAKNVDEAVNEIFGEVPK